MLGASIGDTFYVVGIQRLSDSGATDGAPQMVGAFSSKATAQKAVTREALQHEKREGLDYQLVFEEMTVGADIHFMERVKKVLEES